MPQRKNPARDMKIYKMRLLGIKYSELGKEHGISQQRARQIFNMVQAEMNRKKLPSSERKTT